MTVLKHNVNNPVQNSSFEIVMDDRKIYNTFAEFNTEFNSKLSAIDPGFTSTIDNETGKLTINNASTAFEPMVVDTRIEVLRKFGFLYPTFTWSALVGVPATTFHSQKAVELAQSAKIFIRSNLEPNTYCSNGSENLLGFIPYTLDIKDVNSGGFCYVNPSNEFVEIQERNYDTLELEFLDENMNLMNFASMPISVELQFLY